MASGFYLYVIKMFSVYFDLRSPIPEWLFFHKPTGVIFRHIMGSPAIGSVAVFSWLAGRELGPRGTEQPLGKPKRAAVDQQVDVLHFGRTLLLRARVSQENDQVLPSPGLQESRVAWILVSCRKYSNGRRSCSGLQTCESTFGTPNVLGGWFSLLEQIVLMMQRLGS